MEECMVSFRGDAHKFYLKLKKEADKGNKPHDNKEVQELKHIQNFYSSIDLMTLESVHYRILKERDATGIIPVLVTALPWIFFIFSKQIQAFFKDDGSYLWLLFVFIYLTAVSFSVYIHFKERSWATVHSRMIEDIIKRKNQG
jgi:hypothetical protein